MKTLKVISLLVLSSTIVSCSVPKQPPSPPPSGFSSNFSNYLEEATQACQEAAEGVYIISLSNGVTPQDALDEAKYQYFECAKELGLII